MIDRDQIRKLGPVDGDIFTLPADTPMSWFGSLGKRSRSPSLALRPS